jgi:hypothetical protein
VGVRESSRGWDSGGGRESELGRARDTRERDRERERERERESVS